MYDNFYVCYVYYNVIRNKFHLEPLDLECFFKVSYILAKLRLSPF